MMMPKTVRKYADELALDADYWKTNSTEALLLSHIVIDLHQYAAILQEHIDNSTLPKRKRFNGGNGGKS